MWGTNGKETVDDLLPIELWALILDGTDHRGRPFLAPGWRPWVRCVCSTWATIIAHPTQSVIRRLDAMRPDIANAHAPIFAHLWHHGRLVCASSVVDALVLHAEGHKEQFHDKEHNIDQTPTIAHKGETPDKASSRLEHLLWWAQSVQGSGSDWIVLCMLATGHPPFIERAMGPAAWPLALVALDTRDRTGHASFGRLLPFLRAHAQCARSLPSTRQQRADGGGAVGARGPLDTSPPESHHRDHRCLPFVPYPAGHTKRYGAPYGGRESAPPKDGDDGAVEKSAERGIGDDRWIDGPRCWRSMHIVSSRGSIHRMLLGMGLAVAARRGHAHVCRALGSAAHGIHDLSTHLMERWWIDAATQGHGDALVVMLDGMIEARTRWDIVSNINMDSLLERVVCVDTLDLLYTTAAERWAGTESGDAVARSVGNHILSYVRSHTMREWRPDRDNATALALCDRRGLVYRAPAILDEALVRGYVRVCHHILTTTCAPTLGCHHRPREDVHRAPCDFLGSVGWDMAVERGMFVSARAMANTTALTSQVGRRVHVSVFAWLRDVVGFVPDRGWIRAVIDEWSPSREPHRTAPALQFAARRRDVLTGIVLTWPRRARALAPYALLMHWQQAHSVRAIDRMLSALCGRLPPLALDEGLLCSAFSVAGHAACGQEPLDGNGDTQEHDADNNDFDLWQATADALALQMRCEYAHTQVALDGLMFLCGLARMCGIVNVFSQEDVSQRGSANASNVPAVPRVCTKTMHGLYDEPAFAPADMGGAAFGPGFAEYCDRDESHTALWDEQESLLGRDDVPGGTAGLDTWRRWCRVRPLTVDDLGLATLPSPNAITYRPDRVLARFVRAVVATMVACGLIVDDAGSRVFCCQDHRHRHCQQDDSYGPI